MVAYIKYMVQAVQAQKAEPCSCNARQWGYNLCKQLIILLLARLGQDIPLFEINRQFLLGFHCCCRMIPRKAMQVVFCQHINERLQMHIY